jgi:hypothetical protein
MDNGVVPKSSGHLLLGEIGTGHMDHGFPVAFDESVRGLAASGGVNDIRVMFWLVEIGFDGFAKKFVITIGTKAFGKSSCLGTEKVKSVNNVSGTESW